MKSCFVILPIGAPNSETRKRSNHIYKYVVSEALSTQSYSMSRADTLDQSGQITTQIIDNLLRADLVIADLSDLNANVFYELAIRHAIQKPFIHLMIEGQNPPFDVQGMRTIYVDVTDLDSVHDAKQSIIKTVHAIEGGIDIDTPIRQTIDIQSLRQSENSESRGIADIINEVQLLRRAVAGQGTRSRGTVDADDFRALRKFVETYAGVGRFAPDELDSLITTGTSQSHDSWVREQQGAMRASDDPWANAPVVRSSPVGASGYDDEPPF